MRTVIGLFDRREDAQEAIRDLLNSGFTRENINFISREKSATKPEETTEVIEPEETGDSAASGAGYGAVMGSFAGLLLGLGALAIPGIGPVIAAGPFVTTLAGAGVGAMAGGLLGALIDLGVPEEHANIYTEGIRRGGSLVVVRTENENVAKALSILNRHHPLDIERHAQNWRGQQWQSFSPAAGALSTDELEYNRDPFNQPPSPSGPVGQEPAWNPSVQSVPVTGSQIDEPSVTDNLDYGDLVDEDIAPDSVEQDRQADHDRNIPVSGGVTKPKIHDDSKLRSGGEDTERYEQVFRSHYDSRLSRSEGSFEELLPAYQMGFTYANDPRYREYDWFLIEPVIHKEWERSGEIKPWEVVKEAVRHGWDIGII